MIIFQCQARGPNPEEEAIFSIFYEKGGSGG